MTAADPAPELLSRAERRKEVMRLMREDFDPTPPNWEGREWDDNAEDVADKIVALFSDAADLAAKLAEAERERDMALDLLERRKARADRAEAALAETRAAGAEAMREAAVTYCERARYFGAAAVIQAILLPATKPENHDA